MTEAISEPDEFGLTPEEWDEAQGGKPTVVNSEAPSQVVHDYPGGSGAIVKSIKSVSEMGFTFLKVGGRVLMFPIALLWKFHGEPCEAKSSKTGAKYPRVKK